MYQELQPARSEFVPIRQLNYHVRLWGPATSDLPPLVLVHGWMDVSASYQFVVDAFSQATRRDRPLEQLAAMRHPHQGNADSRN